MCVPPQTYVLYWNVDHYDSIGESHTAEDSHGVITVLEVQFRRILPQLWQVRQRRGNSLRISLAVLLLWLIYGASVER